MGRLFRMQEQDPWRKLTVLITEGTGRAGTPKLWWLESAEEDLQKMDMRNWRVAGPRIVEGNFWRGEGPPTTVMAEEEEDKKEKKKDSTYGVI